MKHKYFFFDMDQTIAPARQLLLPEMYELLNKAPFEVVIVSGSTIDNIQYQSRNLPGYYLGQNGNHANDLDNKELWYIPLEDNHRQEILGHIDSLVELLDHNLNHDWSPIEDRGSQITFSPLGNTAPTELKMSYDPDKRKRLELLEKKPFVSSELVAKIGGSTSLDYIHKDRHKGTNVQKLIDLMGWNKDECIYYGDGLHPGGNDEAVIGVIETVLVKDHHDTYNKLQEMLKG